ncbi:MAG: hypothetical protein HQ481_01660 [Alphaproteobacteria bacterium]|nr:hypothetical protein [Alphaproteobacteria bacterium]
MARGPKRDERVTVADLARMYDERMGDQAPRYRSSDRRKFAGTVKARGFTVSQDTPRLDRLQARADGMRYALKHERLEANQAKLLQQTLNNLELAIRGMKASMKDE